MLKLRLFDLVWICYGFFLQQVLQQQIEPNRINEKGVIYIYYAAKYVTAKKSCNIETKNVDISLEITITLQTLSYREKNKKTCRKSVSYINV